MAGKWRFELYYYDFSLGLVVCAVIAAFTLGSMQSADLTFSDNFLIVSRHQMAYAVGAGALFNLVIALPSTVAFLAMDWQTPGRPADAVGDVASFCVAALSLPALFVAPMAARWSSRVPVVLLRQAFALCLCAIAVRILLRP